MHLKNGRPESIENRLEKEIRVYDFWIHLEWNISRSIMKLR